METGMRIQSMVDHSFPIQNSRLHVLLFDFFIIKDNCIKRYGPEATNSKEKSKTKKKRKILVRY